MGVVIGLAWLLTIVAQVSGNGAWFGHSGPTQADLHPWVGLALFLSAWQLMVAAMMLPSSVPLVNLFARTSGTERRLATMACFLGGYALVWSVFGALAFAGDALLHALVDGNRWLEARDWLVGGVVLVVAGAFQFSELKDRCLRVCRHPGAFLLRFFEPGPGGAFRLGRRHGMSCLGCCWALMLVMFALGTTSLWWMASLAVLMVVEKAMRRGDRTPPVTGAVFLAWGALVLIHPPWFPMVLVGST